MLSMSKGIIFSQRFLYCNQSEDFEGFYFYLMQFHPTFGDFDFSKSKKIVSQWCYENSSNHDSSN